MDNKRLALALILLSQLCFSLWTQSLVVNVTDSAGNPVEGADIQVVYQKAIASSSSDGQLSIKTGASGLANATLANAVPKNLSHNNFTVKASTAYWYGSPKTATVAPGSVISIHYTLPFSLEPLDVAVVSLENLPVKDASVYISSINSKKQTDSSGVASFFVPANLTFTGIVVYQQTPTQFSSLNSSFNGSKRMQQVKVSSYVLPENLKLYSLQFNARVIDTNGSALADYPVAWSFGGKTATSSTNRAGVLVLNITESGPLNITVERYHTEFSFNYNIEIKNTTVKQTRNETLRLSRMLNITSLYLFLESPNCYRVYANVSDPRASLPVSVEMYWSKFVPDMNTTLNISMPIGRDDAGLYVSKLCVKEQTAVTVVAKNEYDRTSKSINLTYTPPKIEPPPVVVEEKDPTEELFLSVFAFFIVASLLIAFLLGRRYLAMFVRFVIEYLRIFVKIVKKKTK